MGKGGSKEEKTEEDPKRTPTLRQRRQEPSSNDGAVGGVRVRKTGTRTHTSTALMRTPTQPQGSEQSSSKALMRTSTKPQGRQHSSSKEPKRARTPRQGRQESSSNALMRTPTQPQGRQHSSLKALMRTQTQPQGSQQSSSKDENVGGARVRETVSSSHTTTAQTPRQGRQESSSNEPSKENSRDVHEAKPKADDKPPLSELTIYSRKRSDALFVAVIDFGTTKTGFCYTTKETPNKLYAYVNGRIDEQPEKLPTIVLLQPDKQFHSFGTEAVEKYHQLVEQNLHHKWYYFERFKMKLHAREKPLTKDMEIDDILGKTMLAMDVFVAAIYFIRKTLLEDLDKISMAPDKDVHWVLTVPAIWDDTSKQFMREAAETAGIPCYMLTLALEPEAASLVCRKYIQIEEGNTRRYMLLDLGGGTVDITCHELNSKGTLKELHPPTGGAFGGTTVDNAFISVLCRIFGSDVIQAFKKFHMQRYLELMAAFERKKSYFDGTGDVNIRIPLELRELYLSCVEEPLEESLTQSTLAEKVKVISDHITLSETLMKDIFNTAVLNIKDATSDLLEKVKDIDNIFLVGGFSESPYVKKVMEEHFGNLAVFPDGASTAVLKGACIYGHEPGAISSRICKYTYGIARLVKFDQRIHPERKKVRMGRFTFCDDVFCKHIELGTEVSVLEPEKSVAHEYYPSTADQRQAVLEVYKSTEKDPMFTDDESCKFVGLIKIDIDTKGDVWTKLNVRLIFGGTELVVEVTDKKNKTLTKGSVEFLG